MVRLLASIFKRIRNFRSIFLYSTFFSNKVLFPVSEPSLLKVDSTLNKENIYCIKENVYLNASRDILISWDKEIHLKGKQAGLFLEALVSASDYVLLDQRALEIIWPDHSGNMKRLHTLAGRLRKYLQEVDSDIRLEKAPGYYRLIIEANEMV